MDDKKEDVVVTDDDIEGEIQKSFDRMLREDPGILCAKISDVLDCELPDIDLEDVAEEENEPEEDEDESDPVKAWWPEKKLRGTAVSIRGDMALFVVPHHPEELDRGEHGRLTEQIKAGVANHWRVSSSDIWIVEVRSILARQILTYLLHPSMRGTLIINPTSDQSAMLCELLWRLGGEKRMLDMIRRHPWLATTPPKNVLSHKIPGAGNISVPLGLWSLLMIRDGVEGKLDRLLPQNLGWNTDSEELLDGCEMPPQAKTTDKEDRPALFQDMTNRIELFDEKDVRSAKKRLESLPDETRRRLTVAYDRLLERPSHRRIVPAPDPSLLDGVMERFPNFARVTSFLKEQVALKRLHFGALSFPAILMVGPPGVGKTEYSHALADALGLEDDHEMIPMSTTSASFVLSGMASGWTGAKPGRIASRLLEGEVGNPLFVADEIDKASGDTRYPAIMSLLSMLERTTARAFQDEFYEGVRLDASHVLWLATANDLATVPDPVLSRFVVFRIDALNIQQTRSVAISMYQRMMQDPIGNHFEPELRDDVLNALEVMTPRELRLALTRALGRAALRPHSGGNLRHITREDLATDEQQIGQRGIGFCASL